MGKFSLVVKNFAPSWFASVMGTGIVAITSLFYSQNFIWLKNFSVMVWVLNMFLFVLIIIPWLLRFILYWKDAISDLRDPVKGQFYPTMPTACLIIAADLLIIGSNSMNMNWVIKLAKGFWFFGVLGALFFVFIIPLQNFLNEKVSIENLNPAWFIPPVGLIVLSIPGAKLIPYWPEDWQQTMLILNYVSWSCGFFLYLFLEALCLYRFICRSPLPGQLAPTAWINLGPIGSGTIALLNISSASIPILGGYVAPVINLLAIFFWGFGFWWLIIAICLTLHNLKNNNLPFSLSWWSFIFPLGAYVGATHLIAIYLKSSLVNMYGFCCYLLLLFFWLFTFIRTVIGVIKMEFF